MHVFFGLLSNWVSPALIPWNYVDCLNPPESECSLSHQSLGYHRRSSPGSLWMHSTRSADGKFQEGRQGSRWSGQERCDRSTEEEQAVRSQCGRKEMIPDFHSQSLQSIQPGEETRWRSAGSRWGRGRWPERWLCTGLWVDSAWTEREEKWWSLLVSAQTLDMKL